MIEVLKQMTEALEDITRLLQGITGGTFSKLDAAIQAGRQAIREHAMYEVQRLGQEIEQEPVAWRLESGQAVWFERTGPEANSALPNDVTAIPLYTTPPQRTWVGLTIDEREQIQQECFGKVPHHVAFAHAVEAKLKEKNT
jgi:hypothetical protein